MSFLSQQRKSFDTSPKNPLGMIDPHPHREAAGRSPAARTFRQRERTTKCYGPREIPGRTNSPFVQSIQKDDCRELYTRAQPPVKNRLVPSLQRIHDARSTET